MKSRPLTPDILISALDVPVDCGPPRLVGRVVIGEIALYDEAVAALMRLDARKTEDVDAWAARLARDVSDAND